MKTLTREQSGFATLVAVIMVSIMLMTSLASIYVYQVNNMRFQRRLKETLKLMSITEEAAKVVRGAWDRAAATFDPSLPNYMDQVSNQTMTNLTNLTMVTNNNLCVVNPERDPSVPLPACGCPALGNDYYCFPLPTNMSTKNWHFEMKSPDSPLQGNVFERFVAKLDNFFDG